MNMRRYFLLGVLTLTVALLFIVFIFPIKVLPRGVWTWDISLTKEQDFWEILTEYKIKTLYLQIPPKINSEQMAKILTEAKKLEKEVYALGGEPSWGLKENQEEVLAFIDKVIDLNQKLPVKFAGIQLDIEPYLLPDWERNWQAVAVEYLDILKLVKEKLSGSGLSFEVVVPFWFDEGEKSFRLTYQGRENYLSGHILELVAGISVMAYRENYEEIPVVCKEELALGEKYGKKVRVGIEVKYFQNSNQVLFTAVSKLEKSFRDYLSFGGIVFHDYFALQKLNDR
ncbi:hypothetical protein ciss_22820 [Carboxydothermus islandicus]|uniref:Uncharacterized protein n=1 Tax=Carboxydothermus islandicus TaxID=661089 RepID=A0A1L8D592_9THEO|nr:hypothetical protein [Carboxydothermus islandicus]GAV26349.1 hypothetical protein ciss_22820 [Carboxydothermus islandicus]